MKPPRRLRAWLILIAVIAVVLARSDFWFGHPLDGSTEFQWAVQFWCVRCKATAISRDHWYEIRFDFDPQSRFER